MKPADPVIAVAVAVFGLVGAIGFIEGAFEFSAMLPMPLTEALSPEQHATFASQQRFLKTLEGCMALVLWAAWPRLGEDRRLTGAVLALFWLTPLSRVGAWLELGAPLPAFQALVVVELVGALWLTAAWAPRLVVRRPIPA